MPYSREELEKMRTVNRGALGMSGLGADPLFSGLLASGVRFTADFPQVDYTWTPGATSATTNQGSSLSQWLMAHVFRPTVSTPDGSVSFAPYAQEADYSWIARILAWIGAAGAALGLGWTIVRALWPTRRTNPRLAHRRNPRRARSVRYYVVGRLAA